ncbi:MAG: hypothetical protein M3Y74_20440, partial [Chloroflexota bacterium]|nr:hypothetical protein [Chloroflexota bacterium]
MILQLEQERRPQAAPTQEPFSLRFQHMDRLLTSIGLWQHAQGDRPHMRHGYSIDDEARGLIVGLRHWQQDTAPDFNARMAATCFQFLRAGALTQGGYAGYYHNFCDVEGKWIDSLGSEDSFGRTLWGLGVAHQVDAPFAPRTDAAEMLTRSLPCIDELHFLRSKAFVILGL